jgi:hypothetical protein
MANNYFHLTLPESVAHNFLSDYLAAPVTVVETPALPSDDQINPNMTLGEMMDKKVSPPGMVPDWTDAARKKYEACISPHIESYKLAVELLNRAAEKDYNKDTAAYIGANLGPASINELTAAFRGDQAVRARWAWNSSPSKAGFGISRGAFWVTFIFTSGLYLYYRREASKAEYDIFVAQTNFFFKKVNNCRQNNPYDMWRVMTKFEQYFEELKYTPSGIIHPNRNSMDDLLNPEKRRWLWLPK